MAAAGNVLRHADDQVVDERIWQIVTDDLEPLRLAIESIAAAIDKAEG